MGNPVEHSLSPIIHQLFAELTGRALTYEKILIDLPRFEQQVRDFFSEGGKGLNITLPCKQRAFAMADQPTTRCHQSKAANTLWMHENHLQADNTDGVGLLRDLGRYIDIPGKHILILGAGGAARGIIGPLFAVQPAYLTIVNRTLAKAQALQKDFPPAHSCSFKDLAKEAEKRPYDIVINATSASLDGENLMLPPSLMATKPLCYDLAYRTTEPTVFVSLARSKGCVAVDGLGMLVAQAAEAFYIWHGVMPDAAYVLNLLKDKLHFKDK
jgi:shikimate dehydrogenase